MFCRGCFLTRTFKNTCCSLSLTDYLMKGSLKFTTMRDNEIIDDLQNGYYIIQRNDGFKFGIDAVLLADFAKCSAKKAIDLCTGTGIIPILLAAKTNISHIDAVEIQPEFADMADRSVKYNKLEDRIFIHECDLKNAPKKFGKSSYDLVTVNPPYMKTGSGKLNEGDSKTIARHEVLCNLEDVIRVSSELLIPQGKFFMVHRPLRLVDIFHYMRKYRIEPKKIRFVAPKPGKEPNLVLIYGLKSGNPELKTMPTLYVYDNDGNYSKEIDEIYGRR